MNIQEALKKVDGMTSVCNQGKREIKELLLTLAGETADAAQPIQEPETDQTFYITYGDGTTGYDTARSDYPSWKDYVSQFNFYPTKELAEHEAKYLRAVRKLRHMARNLAKTLPTAMLIRDMWDIYFNEESYSFHVGQIGTIRGVSVGSLFQTEADAQLALDNLTDEERELLFR